MQVRPSDHALVDITSKAHPTVSALIESCPAAELSAAVEAAVAEGGTAVCGVEEVRVGQMVVEPPTSHSKRSAAPSSSNLTSAQLGSAVAHANPLRTNFIYLFSFFISQKESAKLAATTDGPAAHFE